MDVALVRLADRAMRSLATDDRDGGIHDGHARSQHRHQKRDEHSGTCAAEKRDDAEHEAQRQRARIAHEDAGRMEVETQEADAGAQQNDRKHRRGKRVGNHAQHEDGDGRNGGDARRKAIQAVDQVDDVGKGHQVEHRDGEA